MGVKRYLSKIMKNSSNLKDFRKEYAQLSVVLGSVEGDSASISYFGYLEGTWKAPLVLC